MIVKEISANTEFFLSDHKTQFKKKVSDNDNDIYNYRLLFKLTAKYESFFGKDVLFFSRSQLMSMFEDMGSTASTFEKRYRYLERYFECFGKTIPLFSFNDLDVYENVRRCSIRDLNEFKYIVNSAFKPDDMQTLDVIRKSCVILLYIGVSKSEIPDLLKSDLDEDATRIIIRSNGVSRSIPYDFLETLKMCKEMAFYVSSNPKRINEPPVALQNNDYLIRGDSQREDTEKCPTFFIDKIFNGDTFDSVDKNLTPTRVYEAGLYHWLYQQEKEKYELKQFRDLLAQYFNKPIAKYQHYFQNYYSWKKAFDL